jgi:aminoglycoside 3-N-acetyltransferase
MATQFLRKTVTTLLSDQQKRALKARVNKTRQQLVRAFLRYDAERLKASLRRLGIQETDTILVHANFEPDSGFEGGPADVVEALVDLVGRRGNLLMVSIPFRGAAVDYLAQNKVFNVKKTISMMGLVTELFRRRQGTLRSLHPTHPVLAYGPDAASLVAGHESCLFPCGPGSPFDKLLPANAKIVFFDVGFEAVTFFHHVEHLLKDQLPFPVYDDRLFSVNVIDAQGQNRVVQTYAYNKQVTRRADLLYAEMLRRGKVLRARLGNSRIIVVNAADVLACQSAMVAAHRYPYNV